MSREARRLPDRGSAAVEFTLVSALVVVLFSGVLQLALALHVRNTLISCAAEGARVAAAADRDASDGVRRAEDMVADALGDYPARVTVADGTFDGARAVVVTIEGPMPIVGLWGVGTISATARALDEEAP